MASLQLQVFTSISGYQKCVPTHYDLLWREQSAPLLEINVGPTVRTLERFIWILNLQMCALVPALQYPILILDTAKVMLPPSKCLTLRIRVNSDKSLDSFLHEDLGKMVATFQEVAFDQFPPRPFQLNQEKYLIPISQSDCGLRSQTPASASSLPIGY